MLKRGGIFKHESLANLLPSPLVKKFENRIIVGKVMAKSLVSCFLTHGLDIKGPHCGNDGQGMEGMEGTRGR